MALSLGMFAVFSFKIVLLLISARMFLEKGSYMKKIHKLP